MEYLSLAEIAYQKIKATILKHEIVPGQRLSHEELVGRIVELAQARYAR